MQKMKKEKEKKLEKEFSGFHRHYPYEFALIIQIIIFSYTERNEYTESKENIRELKGIFEAL